VFKHTERNLCKLYQIHHHHTTRHDSKIPTNQPTRNKREACVWPMHRLPNYSLCIGIRRHLEQGLSQTLGL
jgi:hypothetical protein